MHQTNHADMSYSRGSLPRAASSNESSKAAGSTGIVPTPALASPRPTSTSSKDRPAPAKGPAAPMSRSAVLRSRISGRVHQHGEMAL